MFNGISCPGVLSTVFLAMSLLPAQLANVATAALGQAPPVAEFFQRVDEFLAKAPQEQPENKVLGRAYVDLENADKAPGTVKNQMAAYKSMQECAKVYKESGLTFVKLDDFFRAFGKYALHPRFLFEEEEEIESALEDNEALCSKAGVRPRNLKPESFVTMTNSLAALYKRTSPSHGIVPSVENQFPTYVPFINQALKRAKLLLELEGDNATPPAFRRRSRQTLQPG
jgi:hypothetical protein